MVINVGCFSVRRISGTRSSKMCSPGRSSGNRPTLSFFRRGARSSAAASCSSKMNRPISLWPCLGEIAIREGGRSQLNRFADRLARHIGPISKDRLDTLTLSQPVEDSLDRQARSFEGQPSMTDARIGDQELPDFYWFHKYILSKPIECATTVR